MTWRRFLAARRLLFEEFVDGPTRMAAAQARAAEDARFRSSAEALKRMK